MYTPDNRDRIYIRLGKNKRDRRLAAHIAADIEHGINVSNLVKALLYNYYTGAAMPQYAGQKKAKPDEESRQAALSNKLKKLSFSGLG